MKRITPVFLSLFLHVLPIIGGVANSLETSDTSPFGTSVERNEVNQVSLLEKVKQAFNGDALRIDEDKHEFSSITTHIASMNHEGAGLKEILELSDSLEFLTTVLRDSISTNDLPSTFKDSIDASVKNVPDALESFKKIASFIAQAENASDPAQKDTSTVEQTDRSHAHAVEEKTQIEPYRKLSFETTATGESTYKGDDEDNDYDFHSSKSNWNGRGFSQFDDFSRFSRTIYERYHQNGKHSSYSSPGNRRRSVDFECETMEEKEYKTEQCERLAKCASSYTLYDLYVYLYGDDIDFISGSISEEEKITFFDDKVLKEKHKNIIDKAEAIVNLTVINDSDFDDCDNLLQEFYRFNEKFAGIHAAGLTFGKWQGGTVNSVCREADTTKNLSLESILMIRRKAKYGEFTISPNAINDYLDLFESGLVNETSPEARTVAMFEDFVFRCAGGLGEAVKEIEEPIFEANVDSRNPYLLEANRLSIPQGDELKRDEYGQPKDTKLDKFFSYETLSGNILGDASNQSFEPDLRTLLVRTVASGKETVEDFVKAYKKKVTAKGSNDPIWPDDFALFGDFNLFSAILIQIYQSIGYNCNSYKGFYICWNAFKTDPDINTDESDGHRCIDVNDSKLCVPDSSNLFFQVGGNEISGMECFLIGNDQYLCAYTISKLEEKIDSLMSVDTDKFLATCKQILISTDECTRLYNLISFIDGNVEIQKKGQEGSFLDRIIGMIYGDEASVGDVCQYAEELLNPSDDNDLKSVPGYCCLDAPYEVGDFWGEKYSCTYDKDIVDSSGNTIFKTGTAKQKGKEGFCNVTAPYTAGFSEVACDVFSGTWCPQPRNCKVLVDGINDLRFKASIKTNRIAFFEYLDGAPKVKNDEDPVQCGELREYFEYDFDYPKDQNIVENVEHIQCRSDFENIDDYATGTNGPDGGGGDEDEVELFVDETLVLLTEKGFKGDAKAWRTTNYATTKVIELIRFTLQQLEDAEVICLNFVSMAPGTAGVCTAAHLVTALSIRIVLFGLEVGVAISKRIYDETVPIENGKVVTDYRQSTYKNVITNHKNIITTFKGVKQLKKQLGDISDTLEQIAANEEEGSEDESRRMLEAVVKSCIETDRCVTSPNTCKCDDPFYLCNCKHNYEHIKMQEFAGCDGQDSDDDSVIDRCEDRYKPSIIFSDPTSFITFSDPMVLQYSKVVFSNKTHVTNFFNLETTVDDDCQEAENIRMYVDHDSGECENTMFHLTPEQNVPGCNDTDSFQNPLPGITSKIKVNLDEIAPVVECGFHKERSSKKSKKVVKDKTLFHYGSKGLQNSNFFYNVTENCPATVNVEVTLRSNQFEYDSVMGRIKSFKKHGYNEQMYLDYAADSCKHADPDCKIDDSIDINLRFYEIEVIATDSAGHVGMDTCKVIIVPDKKHQKRDADKRGYKRDVLLDAVGQSDLLHVVSSASAIWKNDLLTLMEEKQVDTKSPKVTKETTKSSKSKRQFPTKHPKDLNNS